MLNKFRLLSLYKVLILFESVLLVFFLYWHYKLGISRYFDSDEMAHLHWAYNFFSGMKPYKDFLYFFPPGFLILLWPVWVIAGNALNALVIARVFAFVFFLTLSLAVFLLVREIEGNGVGGSNDGWRRALLTVVFLAFLPLPFDKFIEIRPDTIATAMVILGMWQLIRGIRLMTRLRPEENGTSTRRGGTGNFFFSGLFYSLSIVVSPKTVFFLPAAFLVFLWFLKNARRQVSVLKSILSGGFIPLAGILGFFTWIGVFDKAMYLTFRFASDSSKVLGSKFPIPPDFFFRPNDTFYGLGGNSVPYILNLLIYIGGGTGALLAFMKIARGIFDRSKQEFLVSARVLIFLSFITNVGAYIWIFPMKHAQYLIAIAPLVAYYFAELLEDSRGIYRKLKVEFLYPLSLAVFLLVLGFNFVKMNEAKANWTSWRTTMNFEKIAALIPKGDFVFDTLGETMNFKDPYYICCIPYGQYSEAFKFNLPSLENSLKLTQTKYIYLSDEGRLGVLPSKDAEFIRSHYVVAQINPVIMVPGISVHADKDRDIPFEVVVPGMYKIFWNGSSLIPENVKVWIDGIVAGSAQILPDSGTHVLKTDQAGELKIQFVK